jgi:hypothetical protein
MAMELTKCNECKISEGVKRPDQEPKLICRVTGQSLFVPSCPQGRKEIELNSCLLCKMSNVVKRPKETTAKLECEVLKAAVPIAGCVAEIDPGRPGKKRSRSKRH